MGDFYLPQNENRRYEISIHDGVFSISGDYWCYNVSDIYKQKNSHDEVSTSEYLGIGKLRMRPYRYVVTFIVIPVIISTLINVANNVVFKVFLSSETLEKLSSFVNAVVCILAVLFAAYGIRLLFSLKDLVEISFISKHICIPRKSITDIQYRTLNNILKDNQKRNNHVL